MSNYDQWRTDASELSENAEQERKREERARLSDAAPELLEALKVASQELTMYVDLQQKLDYIEYAAETQKKLDIVNAAIEKATCS